MVYFVIKILSNNVTVDLSKFNKLNPDTIDWGDGEITNDTFSHTYNNAGQYSILANFEDVDEILDNFTIDSLEYINFSKFNNLSTIRSNFLNNCNRLLYLNLLGLDINKIKSGFLNNCTNLEILKLPLIVPELESWGENISSNVNKLKIYIDHKSRYEEDDIWNDDTFTKEWIVLEYIYRSNVNEDLIKNITFMNTIFVNNIINLNECENIKNAIDNHEIYVENDIEELVDEDRRVYKDEELLSKTIFILEYKYKFEENPNNPDTNILYPIYDRIVKAKNSFVENGVRYLQLEDMSNMVFFYLDGDELEPAAISKKYAIKDILLNDVDPSVLKFDTCILPYQEYEDPPYFRGWIRFGEINNENYTNVLYNGDINTGFDIEIKARGKAKNLYIYDVDINEDLGRREFIHIDTDKLPGGQIQAGDYILIKTSLGEKSAILERNGEKIDIMKYIDRSSSWLQIYKGDNMFYAKADNGEGDGSIYNLKINLIWNELYEGI